MLTELTDQNEKIYEMYFNNLVSRFSTASLQIENESGDLSESIQAKKIINQLLAINVALDAASMLEKVKTGDKCAIYKYIDAINKINYYATNEEYNGFRTSGAIVTGSNVERSNPSLIPIHMQQLIDQYIYQRNFANTISDELERLEYIFEIEAEFHIRFLHIHPYGDGNGRTARIILMSNLLSNTISPCVITENTKSIYCKYIEDGNYRDLAKLFHELSDKELNVISEIYWQLDEAGYIPQNHMSEKQLEEYTKVKIKQHII